MYQESTDNLREHRLQIKEFVTRILKESPCTPSITSSTFYDESNTHADKWDYIWRQIQRNNPLFKYSKTLEVRKALKLLLIKELQKKQTTSHQRKLEQLQPRNSTKAASIISQ